MTEHERIDQLCRVVQEMMVMIRGIVHPVYQRKLQHLFDALQESAEESGRKL